MLPSLRFSIRCFYFGFLCFSDVGCGVYGTLGGRKWGPKTVKNGPRVWAFCKIEFPGIQKPVQIFDQKWGFFRNPGNRGVGVIWSRWGVWVGLVGFG